MSKKKKKEIIEEIEILDIDNDFKPRKSNKKVRKLKKGILFRFIFCLTSICFIIGCFIFYGMRLIKYYKIYNPKDENGKAVSLLANKITSSSSFVYDGDGLYLNNGTYIYKGEKVNNYVKFGNLLWRIIKINEDKTIDLIIDNSINYLKWNQTIVDYTSSDINQYLNQEFISYIDKKMLTNTIVCKDLISNVKDISCSETDTSNYVRLLNVDEFLNSKASDKSYISNDSNIWLASRGEKNAWAINGSSLSYAETDKIYDVKPVITLKNSTIIYDGEGTIEKPYIIEKETNDVEIGDYIKLGEDIWTVTKKQNDKLFLSMSSLYKNGTKTYRFSTTSNKFSIEENNSIGKYLNEEFYNSLTYKNLLLENEWAAGVYDTSYKDIYNYTVKAKVGLTSITDLKFDLDNLNYYILNGSTDNKSYIINKGLLSSKSTLSRTIKPSIVIKKSIIKTGSGTKTAPYVLEG